jgi:tetratricopeptide (TPR) repeat protein
VFRRVFTGLVWIADANQGGTDTRRIRRREEFTPDEWKLIDALAVQERQARLVITRGRAESGSSAAPVTAEIAHEVLIRQWKRLSRWLDADRRFRLWLQGAEHDTEGWRQARGSGETDGATAYLYRGPRLDEALRWRQERGEADLRSLADFIHAAVALREAEEEQKRKAAEREKRRQRRILTGVSAGFVITLLLGGAVFWEWRRAVAEQQRAEASVGAAIKAANQLIFVLAQQSRVRQEIPLAILRKILDRAQEILKQLASSGESTPELRRSQHVALNELSMLLNAAGDREAALAAAQNAREIMEGLIATNPSNTEWQRDLSVSYNKIGDVLDETGRREEALDAYRKSLKIFETLAAADPGNAGWQWDVFSSLWRIANFEIDPVPELRRGLDILRKQQGKGALTPDQADWITKVEQRMAELQRKRRKS